MSQYILENGCGDNTKSAILDLYTSNQRVNVVYFVAIISFVHSSSLAWSSQVLPYLARQVSKWNKIVVWTLEMIWQIVPFPFYLCFLKYETPNLPLKHT